ncbi:ABC transporter substrate-binding protein (plasmid) [Halobaculum sp. CBA1158]|uniref:ABC transporter substrate-binding protein n=1 Tax=Halobaculum sp. CBA1158 TaxID=2904243 RepID=UPI001F1D78EB|nr:ABC transporter substrate-binding protein [Halobaculum sp. CBA1158]UIP01368.1 ABC transporter substrate-binding protein [Halobaculum sp. CBA1158]
MSGERTRRGEPTRRDTIKSAGTVAVGGLLAGCTGGDAENDLDDGGSDTADAETSDADGGTTTDGPETTSYEACIEPAGCLTFEEVPETYAVYNGAWADMAFALGQRDGFLTAGNMIPGFFFEPFGLDVPPQGDLPSMWSEGGWDKESFYELDPDVFLIDPNYLHGTGWDGSWDQSDTKEINDTVAPFFGNNSRRRREFHDYKLYTLYEAFDRLADLFQERERYEAFAEVHEEVQTEITDRLPPESERPEVGLINGGSDPNAGQFYPLNTKDEGYEMKPYRDLDVKSAFSQDLEEGGQIDYERLLDIDPEIIIVHWGIGTTGDTDSFSAEAFRDQYVTPMEDDSVGSELTAVTEGNVYPGAYGEQGPIVNLLQTEMKAQQLYPEEFGTFDPEAFPEVPEENQLFDRQRVRDIIAGDL